MRRTLLLGFAVLIPMLAFGIGTKNVGAQDVDDAPCHSPYWHEGQQLYVQKCPLWTGGVPVLAEPRQGAAVVGYLNEGGLANWFVCQGVGDNEYHHGEYYNHWYALTLADNGEWGFVPEVFFSGGGNNQEDWGLVYC